MLLSPSVQAAVAGITTRAGWCQAVLATLGPSRVMVGRWAASGDAWASGRTFWAAPLAGPATHAGGDITSPGTAGVATVQLSEDLTVGQAVLRFASADGVHWVQCTLGLEGSGAELEVPSNPDAQKGFGVAAGWRIRAPQGLPLIEPAPALDANAPASIEVWNWQSGSGVLVGSAPINFVEPDMVFEHGINASEISTVGCRRTAAPIVYDGFKFSANVYVLNGRLNLDNPGAPVYEVELLCGEAWPGYPAMANYNAAVHSTIPKTYKTLIKNAAGTVLHVNERRNGTALNSQTNPARTTTKRVEPWHNCTQPAFWVSARIRPSSQIRKWVPQRIAAFRGAAIQRDVREAYAAGGSYPLITGSGQSNGIGCWIAAPELSLPENSQALSPNSSDPHLFSTSGAGEQWLALGYGYELGYSGCHDWRTGEGGSRFDRSCLAEPLALFAADQNYVRPKGSVPGYALAWEWAKNDFNECYHFITNSTTNESIPKAQSLEPLGGWAHSDGYYGGGLNFVPGGASRHIQTFCIPNGNEIPPLDKDGRMHYNGYVSDFLHDYNPPAWAVLLLNSPAHAVAQRRRLEYSLMANQSDRPASGAANWWGSRQHAWRWLQWTMTWLVGTTSPKTFSQAEIENIFQIAIEAEHDAIYLPAVENNSQELRFVSLRNLGYYATETANWAPPGQVAYTFSMRANQMMYMGDVLGLMKRSGLWDKMRAKSVKCRRQMDFHLECMTKMACEMMIQTNGRALQAGDKFAQFNANNLLAPFGPALSVPASWSEWAALFPAAGQESMLRRVDGTFGERSELMHLHPQFASIRKYEFADIPRPPGQNQANINLAVQLAEDEYNAARAAGLRFEVGMSSFAMYEGAAA